MIYLNNCKEVMLAFLGGMKLQNSSYYGDDYFLYLSETGIICEEDGAGAKADRLPFAFRTDDVKWWVVEEEGK